MKCNPIGIFQCQEQYPYDAARQGSVSRENTGTVVLNESYNFEQAVQDLDGFSHIWLVYQFHQNNDWKPLVNPPRGHRKVGVFATRAPYRPNPIGLSCVRLVSVQGRKIEVAGHDLLNGTPILDIKPYLPYADSFPEATCGWLDEIEGEAWEVVISDTARTQLDWLQEQGVECLEAFLRQQLRYQPMNTSKKRVRCLENDIWEIAYRTWRARFSVEETTATLVIMDLYSGYTADELMNSEDTYGDKAVHQAFSNTL